MKKAAAYTMMNETAYASYVQTESFQLEIFCVY